MPESRPSFEEEMRQIREARNISRSSLHEQTKVALENIELFENGELEQHPHFNDVYLRALVRSYAEALDIPPGVALRGLEKARAGTYEGELGRRYLGRGPETEQQLSASDKTDEEKDVVFPRVGPSPIALADDAPPEKEQAPKEPEPPVSSPDEKAAEQEKAADKPSPAAEEEPPPEASEDAAESSEPPAKEPSSQVSSRRRQTTSSSQRSGTSKVVLGVVAAVLVVAAAWGVLSMQSDGSSAQQETVSPPPADATASGAADSAVEAKEPAPQPPLIGDSLQVTVVAAEGKLEPLRVQLDNGKWNPYWVEQGDSIQVVAADSVTLRSYLNRAQLRVESLVWPNPSQGQYDRLEITRAQVQTYIDSLYTQP